MSSKLKVVPELMLEYNELNRLTKFISDDINNNLNNGTYSYGVINNKASDPQFLNFKVIAGTNAGTIALASKGFATDKDGLTIVQEIFDNSSIPNDGNLYHIVISHQYSHLEVGTVSVSADGIITGVGTEFTKVLRGQPNFPTKIKFYGSASNTGEYSVVETSNDSYGLIAGTFVPETGLRYSVIGTFTPTALIPSINREPYYYDSCLFRIIDQTTWDSMTLVSGKEFKIAEVRNTSGVISINDFRGKCQYSSLDSDLSDGILPDPVYNNITGIECVKWDNSFATKDKNEVSVAWGFRSTNYSIEPSLRKITITAGEGGRYKDSGQFSTGDFDGWRLYSDDGNYKRIISSVKSSTSINLIVESLLSDDYNGSSLLVVPDVEEVLIRVKHDTSGDDIPQIDNEYAFPVNTAVAKIYLLVPSSAPYYYNFSYRYKRFNRYSVERLFLYDSIGYYDESSFSGGVLKPNPIDRTRVPYSSSSYGYIKLTPSPLSYSNVIAGLTTGDVIGIDTVVLANSLPVFTLTVGSNKKYQHFKNPSGLSLSADMYIAISSVNAYGSPLVNGNVFDMHFQQSINLNGYTLQIVTDYVDPTNFTLLKDITSDDIERMAASAGYRMKMTYNGSEWVFSYTADEHPFASTRLPNAFRGRQDFAQGELVVMTTANSENKFTFTSAGNTASCGFASDTTLNEIDSIQNGAFIRLFVAIGSGGDLIPMYNRTPVNGGLPIRWKYGEECGAGSGTLSAGGYASIRFKAGDFIDLQQMYDAWWIVNAPNVIEDWHLVGQLNQPSYQNSWLPYYDGLRYRKGQNGTLYFKGKADGETIGAVGSVVYTLPVGYRPTNAVSFNWVRDGSQNSVGGVSRMAIDPSNGEVSVIISHPSGYGNFWYDKSEFFINIG